MKLFSILIILLYSLNLYAEEITNECGNTVEEFTSSDIRCFERHGEYTIESLFDSDLKPIVYVHDELDDVSFNKLWKKTEE
jgi:hypothetical protein